MLSETPVCVSPPPVLSCELPSPKKDSGLPQEDCEWFPCPCLHAGLRLGERLPYFQDRNITGLRFLEFCHLKDLTWSRGLPFFFPLHTPPQMHDVGCRFQDLSLLLLLGRWPKMSALKAANPHLQPPYHSLHPLATLRVQRKLTSVVVNCRGAGNLSLALLC